jgi:transcriptional regulator of acetoin/glycerol metabolism
VPNDDDDTAPLHTPDATAGRAPCWYVVVALETLRPFSGALRVSLEGITAVSVGRGPRRGVTRDGQKLRLELDDRYQSKDHFQLIYDSGSWHLQDSDSKNGTRCRGVRVAHSEVCDGDVIEVGATFLVMRRTDVPVEDQELSPESNELLRTLHAGFAAELELIARLAPTRLPILVRGESGTGKELAARSIHAMSVRSGALIAVNCGALPVGLAEAELFGSRRGAFSGAVEDRPGLVRTAEGGTLFLDEIADLPLPAQAALLRFLQEGEVRSLGAHRTSQIEVRVIAASHRDLDALVEHELFRHDLLARLRGHVLTLPPLRQRREDLGLICAQLLLRFGDAARSERTIQRSAARALFTHRWPGNVRELEHALHLAMTATGAEITLEDLPADLRSLPSVGGEVAIPRAGIARTYCSV